jgi:hypothetical protein
MIKRFIDMNEEAEINDQIELGEIYYYCGKHRRELYGKRVLPVEASRTFTNSYKVEFVNPNDYIPRGHGRPPRSYFYTRGRYLNKKPCDSKENFDDKWWNIQESVELTPDFKIGDDVYVNGYVDERPFRNVEDTISDVSMDEVYTDMNENGNCDFYHYKGKIYRLRDNNWWVSLYNLTKRETIRKISKIDPYGEENWEK